MVSAQAAPAEVIVPQILRREPSTVAEAVSSLELERNIFDSCETEILSNAFLKAWAYVEFDPALGKLRASDRQSELARCLMAVLKLGDCNPTSIANSAIALMRRNLSGTPQTRIAAGASHSRRAFAR